MKRKHTVALLLVMIIISFSILPGIATLEEDLTKTFHNDYNNDFNKLHFYFGDVTLSEKSIGLMSLQSTKNTVENKYSYIDDEKELDSAIDNMEKYLEKYDRVDEPILVTVEFNSDFTNTPEYKKFCEERSHLKSIEEVRTFRKRLNSFSKKYHREENERNLALLKDFEYSEIDVIDYSPFVAMKTDRTNILSKELISLAKNNIISNISLNLSENLSEDVLWNNVLKDIEAYDIVSNEIYTGANINIGILEAQGVCDTDSIYLRDIKNRITFRDGYTNEREHATDVTSIIAKIAPDANYFITYGIENNLNNDLSWYLDNECDVINCSGGLPHYEYTHPYDTIVDYQVKTHFISFVKSAGNFDNATNVGRITSPGYAHNAITVGGVDRGGLINTYLEYDSDACYMSTLPISKPEVSALLVVNLPYQVIPMAGTSFAAPQVTGAIALLLEKSPNLATDTGAIKALVMASANKTEDYVADVGYLDDRVGAGSLDVNELLNIETLGYKYVTPEMNLENTVVAGKTINLSQGDELQAAACWYATLPFANSSQKYITNYDLKLYNENNVLVCESTFDNTNTVEFIRYTAPTTGQYTLSVYLNGTVNPNNPSDYVYYACYVN